VDPELEPLFRPFRVKTLELANRIVMAPMTRGFSPGGVPGPDVAAYYRRRAENDVGLIVTEGTVIDHPASSGNPAVPYFHGDEALAGWARVLASVHGSAAKSSRNSGMLCASVGSDPDVQPVSPSGIAQAGSEWRPAH
jgi:2,4-dienoyl-CoA reductase-like NADH-dependent reductase (Old Yellow Enzyme family)